MRARSRAALPLLLALLLLAGCSESEGIPLDPLPSGSGRTELRLGDGARALSSGPGYKASPTWSPDGERIAFTVDGYVVDRSVSGGEERLWTPTDLGVSRVTWDTPGSLLASVAQPEAERPGSPAQLYRVVEPGPEGPREAVKVLEGALATTAGPGTGGSPAGTLVALRSGGSSSFALVRDGRVVSAYPATLPGEVSGMSLAPDGQRLIVSARGSESDYSLTIVDLEDGTITPLLTLPEGEGVIGAPQWTTRGIYYLTGEQSSRESGATGQESYTPQRLLLLRSENREPEAAPGLGSGFVASSIQLSPDGERLAVLGRLGSDAPTNVYILELEEGRLRSLTTNEDMEIRNGPDDLAWSPDGEDLAIIARGASPAPRSYPAPADSLLEAFYNVYSVPVEPEARREEAAGAGTTAEPRASAKLRRRP